MPQGDSRNRGTFGAWFLEPPNKEFGGCVVLSQAVVGISIAQATPDKQHRTTDETMPGAQQVHPARMRSISRSKITVMLRAAPRAAFFSDRCRSVSKLTVRRDTGHFDVMHLHIV